MVAETALSRRTLFSRLFRPRPETRGVDAILIDVYRGQVRSLTASVQAERHSRAAEQRQAAAHIQGLSATRDRAYRLLDQVVDALDIEPPDTEAIPRIVAELRHSHDRLCRAAAEWVAARAALPTVTDAPADDPTHDLLDTVTRQLRLTEAERRLVELAPGEDET